MLDTNVLMHDPTSLFRFEEHDVYLPMVTLEELDDNKKGMSEVARNARQVSRFLDEIVSHGERRHRQGHSLSARAAATATGPLFLQTHSVNVEIRRVGRLAARPTTRSSASAMYLKQKYPKREVVLVSKDINMRIKAHALGLPAEDYFNDKVLEDTDLLYTGMHAAAGGLLGQARQGHRELAGARPHALPHQGPAGPLDAGEPVRLPRGRQAVPRDREGRRAARPRSLQTLKDYSHHKNNVWGITARNREQNFALNLLMDPEIDFVTLLGQAGTGKTLLTLAAGLMQTLEYKVYTEIIMTRVTVPVGEDIGFLPGTEEEKMTPWMGALEDNLDVLMQDRRRGRRLGPRRDRAT